MVAAHAHRGRRVDGDAGGSREGLLADLDVEVVGGRLDERELAGRLKIVVSTRKSQLVGVAGGGGVTAASATPAATLTAAAAPTAAPPLPLPPPSPPPPSPPN